MTTFTFDGECSSWYDLWEELESSGFIINDIKNGYWMATDEVTCETSNVGPRCDIDLLDSVYTAEQCRLMSLIFDKWKR